MTVPSLNKGTHALNHEIEDICTLICLFIIARFFPFGNRHRGCVLNSMHAYDKLKAKWDSLYAAMDLFGASMAKVCGFLAYECPYYLEKVKKYIEILKNMK